MSENRTGKYLKYAIGEIILVVIGILIAIQLNGCWNDTVNSKQKQMVLKSLKADFESNKSQLDTVLMHHSKIQNTYPVVMNLIKIDTDTVNEATYAKAYIDLGKVWTFNPINGALRSAISSGEIHLIKNDRLLELLFSWEDIIKDSEEEGITSRSHKAKSYGFIQKHIRIKDALAGSVSGLIPSNHPSDYKSLFKDPLFEDYASLSFLYSRSYTFELNTIKTNNLEIIKLIDEELKK